MGDISIHTAFISKQKQEEGCSCRKLLENHSGNAFFENSLKMNRDMIPNTWGFKLGEGFIAQKQNEKTYVSELEGGFKYS